MTSDLAKSSNFQPKVTPKKKKFIEMAGIRLPPEESELSQQQQQQQQSRAAGDLVSDDERSVAADSWSIKSDYGSTLDDDQRHADAAEALSSANVRASSDYK